MGDESDVSTSGVSCTNSSGGSVDHSPKAVTPVTPPKVITQTLDLTKATTENINANTLNSWANLPHRPLLPKTFCKPQVPTTSVPGGIGRLDLLALAVEHAT